MAAWYVVDWVVPRAAYLQVAFGWVKTERGQPAGNGSRKLTVSEISCEDDTTVWLSAATGGPWGTALVNPATSRTTIASG